MPLVAVTLPFFRRSTMGVMSIAQGVCPLLMASAGCRGVPGDRIWNDVVDAAGVRELRRDP